MIKNTNNIVHIFSDGWANPNPGPGGYGVILKCGEHQKDISEGYKKTTNNRMELRWVIAWLQSLKKSSKVIITTDSQYTINGIKKWWAKKWQSNNWFRTKSQKAQNWDLWEVLLAEIEKHSVTFEWIKWHTGHFENEICDELATLAMKRNDLLEDIWYVEAPVSSQTSLIPWSKKNTSKTASVPWEKIWQSCKKCEAELEKKIPKHSKKTLEKQYYYEYYHHCPSCKTNYMLEAAKRDIKNLKL